MIYMFNLKPNSSNEDVEILVKFFALRETQTKFKELGILEILRVDKKKRKKEEDLLPIVERANSIYKKDYLLHLESFLANKLVNGFEKFELEQDFSNLYKIGI